MASTTTEETVSLDVPSFVNSNVAPTTTENTGKDAQNFQEEMIDLRDAVQNTEHMNIQCSVKLEE